MEYLLSSSNIRVLESFALVHTVFAFDFDGTLSPLVESPDQAILPPESTYYLQKLSEISPVAIITGRNVEDVQKKLNFKPKYIIGNHGIEGCHTDDELEIFKLITQDCKKAIQDKYQTIFLQLGIQLEDKVYSLSLHFRNAVQPEFVEKFLQESLNIFPNAVITKGKMVLNILPKKGSTKGDAFIRLMALEDARFGLYIGDDVTDEDVFIFKNPRFLTVRVGHSKNSLAGYYLKNQDEVVKVLEILYKKRSDICTSH